MPDPIQRVDPTQPLDAASTGRAPAAPVPGGPVPQPTPGSLDTADIARAERLLATIATAAAQVPASDPARVAELQRAILSGTYRVDPQQIARKLVELEQLLAPAGS